MSIRVDKIGSRIGVAGSLNARDHKLCREIPGSQFTNRAGYSFTFPLAVSACKQLRETFGDRLQIHRDLAAWAREEIARQERMDALGSAADATLTYLADWCPVADAAMASRSYQRVAARFIADGGNVLITDEQGLGKCIETLAGNVETAAGCGGRRYLILAPLIAVTTVWPGEIARWVGEANARVVALDMPSLPARRAALATALESNDARDLYVVTNIEGCRIKPERTDKGKDVYRTDAAAMPGLFSIEWDCIVVDECHKALIRTTGKPTQTRAGFERLSSRRRLALSGTPMRGKPQQLWGTLNWLRPDLYSSYWRWVEQYFKLDSNGFSDYVIGDFLPDGKERLGADLRAVSLRRTKAEVLTELPAKQYAGTYLIPSDDGSPHGVWLPLNAAQERQYRDLTNMGSINGVDGGEIIVNGHLAERTRARQVANAPLNGNAMPILPCPKFDWLLNKLDELGIREGSDDEGNAKIVVSSFSTRTLNAFADALRNKHGIPCYLLTGETPAKARQMMVADFQGDDSPARVFLMNALAGGVGVTLDAADDLVLLDESGIPDDTAQVEDRVHRASRIHQVTIHQLRSLGTIEEEIAWVAAARLDVQRYLLDGARGVEYARQLYVDSKRT